MALNRRELLGGLGAASASAILWAMGCRAQEQDTLGARADADDVAAWLRSAVVKLATAFPAQAATAHALAVSRARVTAAVDVLGRGVSRGHVEGVVLRVQRRDGAWHEEVTADLSRAGVDALAERLTERPGARDGAPRRGGPAFGPPAKLVAGPSSDADDPLALHDRELLERVDAMASADTAISSRIVYAASVLDIDDTTLWSVALGRQRAQRSVRVRRSVTRVAWNGTRPVVSELARGWRGGVDDLAFAPAEIQRVSEDALALMTPGELADGDYDVELAPAIVATVLDAAARELLTSAAARRPEVAARLAVGAAVASPLLSLVDDPTAAAAYGGFAFDDEGADAQPVPLLVGGRVVGRFADRAGAGDAAAGRGRRPGHLGPLEAAASHLRLAVGGGTRGKLVGRGLVLDGARGCVIDPSSDRVVISARRADAVGGGDATGRKWADVEVVGELGALLAAVSAVSADALTVPIRDEAEGLPRWRSIETPAIATRAHVRARRRST